MERKEINSFGDMETNVSGERRQINNDEVKILPVGYALNIFLFIIALPIITIAAVGVLLGDLFRG